MDSSKVFQTALLVSLITHGAILFQSSNFGLLKAKNREEKSAKITYVKPKEEQKELRDIKPRREPFIKLPPNITADNRVPVPQSEKENIFNPNKTISGQDASLLKPAYFNPDIISIKKKISFSPIETKEITSPAYIGYQQIIREKIRRVAYQFYTGREMGEVTVSFVVSQDGSLKGLRVLEERSSPSKYLQDIALKSVQEASSFPIFPKELDYPQIPFSLSIIFEAE